MPDKAALAGPARLEVELEKTGRHFGEMFVPYSHDRSAYGRISVPVAVVRGGPGPTLLCVAGIHGDEYEGQIALMRLAHLLDFNKLSGRVVIVAMANPPASMAARRTSPVDGVNMARCFPGKADGSPSEQLAEGMSRLLLPLADCVVDFHSGGSTLDYLPCAFGRLPDVPALADRVLDLMQAFGAPHTFVVTRPEASATFVSAALEKGVPAMATELGGAGQVTRQTLDVAWQGLFNILAFMGMIADVPKSPTRLMEVLPGAFLRAPGAGMFEPASSLGAMVEAGDIAGRLWNSDRPERAPEDLFMPDEGMVVCRRVPVRCERADVLLHLARDVSVPDLLRR